LEAAGSSPHSLLLNQLLVASQLNELRIERKKAELDYWNKNLWKWRYYVWILRKIRKFRKKPNEADDRVCRELGLMCESFNRPINVIDLCCGDGSSLTMRLLKNKKMGIIGVDISKECAKSSRGLRASGFECVAADCEYSPIKNDAVDAAIIRNSLHHLTDLRGLIKEVGRILHTEAVLLIIEVETKSPFSNFVYHRILAEPNYPFVTQEDVVPCLKEEGFAVNNIASLKVAARRSFFVSAIKIKTEIQTASTRCLAASGCT
jgi:ubiquinone/menaquinone biosynthesis C-methylase UbiE